MMIPTDMPTSMEKKTHKGPPLNDELQTTKGY